MPSMTKRPIKEEKSFAALVSSRGDRRVHKEPKYLTDSLNPLPVSPSTALPFLLHDLIHSSILYTIFVFFLLLLIILSSSFITIFNAIPKFVLLSLSMQFLSTTFIGLSCGLRESRPHESFTRVLNLSLRSCISHNKSHDRFESLFWKSITFFLGHVSFGSIFIVFLFVWWIPSNYLTHISEIFDQENWLFLLDRIMRLRFSFFTWFYTPWKSVLLIK